jgi:predicted O-methyltransferase YrrM
MSQDIWTKVDEYIESVVVGNNGALKQVYDNSIKNNLPEINVSPAQGKLLQLLVMMKGAKRILEIGTLGGYSSVWMARADKDVHITTIETDAHHAKVAGINFETAGVAEQITLIHSDAQAALENMVHSGTEPFDFIFLDADKHNNPVYLELCLKMAVPGTVIICDNIVRKGELINAESADPDVQGSRKYSEMIGSVKSLRSTIIQTVGRKGYDGFTLSVVE